MRMREKLSGYCFDVKWVAGKNHQIADALSRAPLFEREEEPDIIIDTAVTCLCVTNDPSYSILLNNIDSDYKLCCSDLIHDTSHSSMIQKLSMIRDRLSVQGDLILFDSTRIIPPTSAIKDILSRLHAGHGGQEKTLFLANKLFYWPGLANDVKTYVQSCSACYKRLPSQKQKPCVSSAPSASFGPPMTQIGLDLFDFAGKKTSSLC